MQIVCDGNHEGFCNENCTPEDIQLEQHEQRVQEVARKVMKIMTANTLDEQFEIAAKTVHAKKAEFEKTVQEAMKDLAKTCEEHGIAVSFRLGDEDYRVRYTPKNTKKWADVDENLRDEYDTWGSPYGINGWSSSAIC